MSSQKTMSFDQSQMAGKINRFVTYAFLQATISRDHIGVVIDNIRRRTARQHTLGHRHADGGRNALSERARRRLDALRVTVFRVPGRLGAKLAETLQLLDRHLRIAGEIVQCV